NNRFKHWVYNFTTSSAPPVAMSVALPGVASSSIMSSVPLVAVDIVPSVPPVVVDIVPS
ncbi:31197_t:CDS:2, partial [Racocetra persica]